MVIPFKFDFDIDEKPEGNIEGQTQFINPLSTWKPDVDFDIEPDKYLEMNQLAQDLGTSLYPMRPRRNKSERALEYDALFSAYNKNKTAENLRKLLTALDPVIEKGWKTFGKGIPVLKIYAKIITINAIQTYDPKKGDLESHVMLHLQRLNRLLPEVSNVIDVPEAIRMKAKMLREAEIELEDKYGRPPSDQELADHLKISLKQLQAIRRAQGAVPESVVAGNLPIKSKIELDEETKLLIYEAVYKDLPPIQQYIMERRLGLHGHRVHSVEEIAKQLKISPAAVSQHIKQIEEKLNLVEETLYETS